MQSVAAFLSWLGTVPLAVFMRESPWAFPTVESIHVVALALVVGTIAIVDLRLLGLASAHRPYRQVAREVLPCTWGAFVVAAIAGTLMFISQPVEYFANVAFRIKILLLLAAGANMLVFQLITHRTMSERERSIPLSGKIAGALSLALWVAVVFFGRRIGFTMSPV